MRDDPQYVVSYLSDAVMRHTPVAICLIQSLLCLGRLAAQEAFVPKCVA